MESPTEPTETQVAENGISRRRLLQFAGAMAGVLCLPPRYARRVAAALASAPRPPLVWLELQDCAGNTESFLRASQPGVDELLLDRLSLNYHETIMVPAGSQAQRSLADTLRDHGGHYIAVVEGAIPVADDGVHCTIHGRTALDIAKEVCGAARATIAVGACAFDGGVVAAAPNPTAAVGVRQALPELQEVLALPGCPANAVNLTAAIVHLITFNELPAADEMGRPLFAYGDSIHHQCERRDHHDAGRLAVEWGDDGHRLGWCLRGLGCRGPNTSHNCPTARWNEGTSWPVAAGHGCLGCSEPGFWDTRSPFYAPDWRD